MTDLSLNAGHFVFLSVHFAIALSILCLCPRLPMCPCNKAHTQSDSTVDTQHKLSLMLQSLHRHCLRLLTGVPHHCCPVIPCLHLHY